MFLQLNSYTHSKRHQFPKSNKELFGRRTLLISQAVNNSLSHELCGRLQYELGVLGIQTVACTMKTMYPVIENIEESVGTLAFYLMLHELTIFFRLPFYPSFMLILASPSLFIVRFSMDYAMQQTYSVALEQRALCALAMGLLQTSPRQCDS